MRSIRQTQGLLAKAFRLGSNHPKPTAHHKHKTLQSTNFCATLTTLTPEEAGVQAYQQRLQHEHQHQSPTIKINPTFDTILSHAGLPHGISSGNDPLCPPLHLASTYTRPPSGDYEDGRNEDGEVWKYARMGNPTRSCLENVLSGLEMMEDSSNDVVMGAGGEGGYKAVTSAFSSGMAAASAMVLAHSQRPVYIIIPDDRYHGVPVQLSSVFEGRNVFYTSVDMTDVANIQKEVERILCNDDDGEGVGVGDGNINGGQLDVLVWIETPSNPLCKVTDIKLVCDWVTQFREAKLNGTDECRISNISTVVDSTWAPPVITQPLLLGADAVLHSGTKYLGGHSDLLLGSITTSPLTSMGRHLATKIRNVQIDLGATASPFDSWLVLRGLRTLHVRIQRQCYNALAIAQFLNDHPIVTKVHYPGLKEHPQHHLAQRQMGGMYGGMLSFEVEGEAMAVAVAGGLGTVRRATSLGGTETLVEHRYSVEPEGGKTSPEGLLRLSVGLEDVGDLVEDLDVALGIAANVCRQ